MTLELTYAMPGRKDKRLKLGEPTIMVGSLLSNTLALAEPGVEPIHCLIEADAEGRWRVVDLGTLAGVRVNGTRIDVETELKDGDILELGSARLTVAAAVEELVVAAPKATVRSAGPGTKPAQRTLFQPRHKSQSARDDRLLEVVAYWGNTVLNVDHFHPTMKGFDSVTIGDPTKAHFISGGREFFKSRVLADVEDQRCVLRLTDDMQAQVRKDGQVRKVVGNKHLSLGPRDYAQVEYGPVRYFLHYASPPKVELPVLDRRDPFFTGLSIVATLAYLVLVVFALITKPLPEFPHQIDDGPWKPVQVDPLTHKPIHVHEVHHEQIVVEVHVPPPVVHPVTPVAPPPVHVQPEHKQPVPPPVVAHNDHSHESLHPEPHPVALPPVPTPQTAATGTKVSAHVTPTPSPAPAVATTAPAVTHKAVTTASKSPSPSGAPAGDHRPSPSPGNSGGPGSHNAQSGALAGTKSFNNPGQEGGKQPAPSMPNLQKLGAGMGLVHTAPGGIHANFASAPGGLGAKAGTASHDHGLGTPGSGSSLDLPGSANAAGSWGNGPGGGLGGGNGPGGIFGHGPGGPGFGGNGPGGDLAANGGGPGAHRGAGSHLPVSVEVSDPVVSPEGLTSQEILMVIRQHLNEIRHCYEQTLQRSPSLAGKIKVAFAIGLNGRVTTVNVAESTINDMQMRGCVTSHVQRWAFPHPRGSSPVQVTYPFIFNPL